MDSKINRHHVGLLAEFLQKLSAVTEGECTLLHGAMIVYGSGLSDGNRHNHDDLPILPGLAAAANGIRRHNRRYPEKRL